MKFETKFWIKPEVMIRCEHFHLGIKYERIYHPTDNELGLPVIIWHSLILNLGKISILWYIRRMEVKNE